MVKITKEEFERLQPRCQCPDGELIQWNKEYKYKGVPKYIFGHNRRGKHLTEEQKTKISITILSKTTVEFREEQKNNRKEYFRQYGKKYYVIHKEKINKQRKDYYKTHKEQENEKVNNWNKEHPLYYQQNKEHIKDRVRKYLKTPNGKIVNKKHRDKHRRELDYNILNCCFESSQGHHINKVDVIYIPKTLHSSINHNVFTWKNMEVMNTLAFFFLIMQNIKELNKLFS